MILLHFCMVEIEIESIYVTVTVAVWYRLPLGTEQVVSSIPGSVGYISHVH